jgi:hypothetical protein
VDRDDTGSPGDESFAWRIFVFVMAHHSKGMYTANCRAVV